MSQAGKSNVKLELLAHSCGSTPERFPVLALELVFTVALVGLALYGALNLWPTVRGKAIEAIGSVLVATLLPIGTLLTLSLLERLLPPAGPRKSLKSWLLHLQLNVFYGFMAGLAGALAALTTTAVSEKLGIKLGWIDLRFAEGKGAASPSSNRLGGRSRYRLLFLLVPSGFAQDSVPLGASQDAPYGSRA